MEGGPYVWVCMDGEYVCMLGDVGRRVHLYGHTPHTVTQPLLAHTDLGSGGNVGLSLSSDSPHLPSTDHDSATHSWISKFNNTGHIITLPSLAFTFIHY